ncbi:Uncharacterised protein [uncultured archaeon]|nr:Uncharacterised protein [uncultured archaeon]
MGFWKELSDLLKISKEARNWQKLQLKKEDIRKVENYTQTISGLNQTFVSLNSEMRGFNENISQSNSFLKQIADLQQSMEKQTKTANTFTWVVVALAILQVIIACIPYRKNIVTKIIELCSGGKIDFFFGIPLFAIIGILWILFGFAIGLWYKFSKTKPEKDTINAIAIIGGFTGIGITVIALAMQAP